MPWRGAWHLQSLRFELGRDANRLQHEHPVPRSASTSAIFAAHPARHAPLAPTSASTHTTDPATVTFSAAAPVSTAVAAATVATAAIATVTTAMFSTTVLATNTAATLSAAAVATITASVAPTTPVATITSISAIVTTTAAAASVSAPLDCAYGTGGCDSGRSCEIYARTRQMGSARNNSWQESQPWLGPAVVWHRNHHLPAEEEDHTAANIGWASASQGRSDTRQKRPENGKRSR